MLDQRHSKTCISLILARVLCKKLKIYLNIYWNMFVNIRYHHHFMLDPVLSPLTELAGFRMVIVFTTPHHFVQLHASSFTSPFFFISFSTLFPRLFRSSSSSTTAHFKVQSVHYHIFIIFPQNMTVPPHATSISHPI